MSLFVNSQTPRKLVGSAKDGCLAQDYPRVHLNPSVCFLTLPWNLDLPLAAAGTGSVSVTAPITTKLLNISFVLLGKSMASSFPLLAL